MNLRKVEHNKNFCRVFELPEKFSREFCFGGGIDTNFRMVDWFQPIPIESPERDEKFPETWEELEIMLREFVEPKVYVKPGRKYVCITDFDKSFVFGG